MTTITETEATVHRLAGSDPLQAEVLFREARMRARRRRLQRLAAIVVAAAVVATVLGFATSSTPGAARPASATLSSAVKASPRLLACNNKPVFEPASFIISCADANSELTRTVWTTWSMSGASGTTTFGLNLCNPYCAASKISFFPKSKVVLSKPVSTKHGELFADLVVTYKLHGKLEKFAMSWTGDPSFKA